MKKALGIIVSALLMSTLLSGSTYGFWQSKSVERYRYVLNASSDDWFNYTVLEKNEMLQIPQEILSKLSDIQLLYAIADYPYFGDAYAYGIDKNGLDTFAKYCSAFREFLARESFLDSLNSYGIGIAEKYASDSCDPLNNLRAQLIMDLISFYNSSSESLRDTTIYVYTPNGTPVPALIRDEIHEGEYYHYPLDQYYLTRYNIAYLTDSALSWGTCKYNCHAYAWSYPSPACPYWIDYPSNYMSDGSYSQVFSGAPSSYLYAYSVNVNDIIYYPNGSHSARLIGNPYGGQQLANIQAKSKWGEAGLFSHAVGEVPAGWQGTVYSIWH